MSHSYSYRVLGPLNTETQQTNKQHHPVLTNHKTTTGITGVTRRSLDDLFQRVNPSHPARNTSSLQAYRRKKTLATRAKNPDTSHRRKKPWLPMQKTSSPKCLVYVYIYIWWFLVQIIQLSFSGVHFRCRYYAHYTSCWCFWKMFDSLIGISSAYKSKEILETAKHVNTYRFIRRCSGLSSSPIRNCHRALHIHPFYTNQWILTLLTLLSNHD